MKSSDEGRSLPSGKISGPKSCSGSLASEGETELLLLVAFEVPGLPLQVPESYQDLFDTLEIDWSEMTNSKFLAEAQKCEMINAKARQKMEKAKETLKRKKRTDTDSVSALSRPQKTRIPKASSPKSQKPPLWLELLVCASYANSQEHLSLSTPRTTLWHAKTG